MRDGFTPCGGPYHFFSQKLPERGRFEHLIRQKLLQLRVLILQSLQT